ncbi:glycoside hydrolase family 15 protein [Actinomadura sp. HBU206391]|uniref:glycoside hydrolase family 15 protein n=1 Tax=Actinomadura sp. HBU206391 TaxID=2731692 RepID=UPI002905A6D7|nr:glycoside hydrolase family 15 protein [Actinomadura sp. HBU206391]
MTSAPTRQIRRVAALLVIAALAATCGATIPDRTPPEWSSPGLVGGGGWPYASEPLAPLDADGATYLPDSSVVLLGDGRARLVPFGAKGSVTVPRDDPRVDSAVRADRSWLHAGHVPGSLPAHRNMAARALLDLRLLTGPSGASVASWYGAWRFVWPRDSAFAAAALTATGHALEARRILKFLARVQDEEGMWAARYKPDGGAVTDGRRVQFDSLGWVLWASWLVFVKDPAATARMPELWPMVRRAADRLSSSLGADGLPPPSSDYWERSPRSEEDPRRPTLGVVSAMFTGLRGATAIARARGAAEEAHRWQTATGRLSAAISRQFAPYGYPRSPVEGGAMDAAVTFLAPPFAAYDPGVYTAVRTAAAKLRLPGGGVLPGERWAGNRTVAWTPETAMFALAAAASGYRDEATGWLDWLAGHRTSLGVLPEKVDQYGLPAAVAPLGWTASLVVLALEAQNGRLPIP